MNSIERRYADFDSDWLLINKSARVDIVKMTVLYIMRAVTSQEYSDLVREHTKWSGPRMSEFRNELKFCGYLQRDLKFYVYEAVVDKKFSLSSRILKEDRTFVQKFISGEEDNYTKALVSQCKAFKKLGYVARNLNVFAHKCESMIDSLDLYCKKFVIKKLRFVVQQNAMTIQDMVNELICYGIYAVYRAYPEIQSNMHMLNIAKQAVHNRGENIIKEATTQSRSRLVKNEDGTFSAKVISLSNSFLGQDPGITSNNVMTGGMLVCTSLMSNLEGTSAENESGANVDAKRDLRQKVDELLSQVESPKARKFIELLMGVYDPEFSQKLGQDNDELVDSLSRQEYAELVRQYLNVPVDKARSFVKGLRTELVDFRN